MTLTRRYAKYPVLLLLLAISLLYIVPVIMMSFGSLKSQSEAIEFNVRLPEEAQWSNYDNVIRRGKILNGYKNSILLTSLSTFFTIAFGGFAGITISRRRETITGALYYYFLFGITITLQIAATFSLLKTLNIYGTYLSAIAIFTAQRMPFTVMTFTSFVKGVPREIDEAAIVDGAGVFRLYTQILMPILKPIILTNTIVTIIAVWNNFNVILFFLNSSKKATISLTIYNFFGMFARDWHYVFAALVLTILPVVLVYLWLQRYIVAGMTSGAVKG